MIDLLDLKPKNRKLPTRNPLHQMKVAFSLFLFIFGAWQSSLAVAQQNGISTPTSGEIISGVVTVTGTAVDPNYLRYELAFRNENNQAAGWIVFAEGNQPVNEGVLAIWDTTVGQNVGAPVFPDGRYRLRLRVVKTDYNYDEYFVTDLTISNAGPTPVPTPDETALTVTAAATGQNGAQPAGGTAVFNPPTPLPSLTPFPTPTPPPAPTSLTGETTVDTVATGGGVIGQLEAVDSGRFASAFWSGVKVTVALFGLLAAYLLLRQIGRRVWRKFWAGRH